MTKEQYHSEIEWLFSQTPNYQIDGKKAYKPGLENITALCDFFGNPQNQLKTIHIGGTNGKGSTSNMLASILQEQGYKVGLYNSPHLIDFTERIKINGENCDKEFVYQFIQKLRLLPKDIRPSFFEFTTVMAFEYFSQNKVDFAIIEVGLGGRLDSTNIINPIVSAITNVDYDHMDILGETLEEIASEKAGIIKKETPIISGDEKKMVKKILQDKAKTLEAKFVDATNNNRIYETDLKGIYQNKNINVAISIIDVLREKKIKIEETAVECGLLNVHKNTGFIGRWFVFSEDPFTILDTAHNQAGLELVFQQLNEIKKQKHIVLGFVNEKKLEPILEILPKNAFFYFVKPAITRGRHPKSYESLIDHKKKYQIFDNVQSGYLAAKQNVKSSEMIFIGGSNFVVGEFLEKNL